MSGSPRAEAPRFSFTLDHNDFERVRRRMGGERNSGGGFREGKLVRDQAAEIELSREDQARHLGLQEKIGGIAPDQVLLVHTDGCQIKGRLIAAPRMGEQQHLPAAPHQSLRLPHHRIGRHRDDGGVQPAVAGELLDESRESRVQGWRRGGCGVLRGACCGWVISAPGF